MRSKTIYSIAGFLIGIVVLFSIGCKKDFSSQDLSVEIKQNLVRENVVTWLENKAANTSLNKSNTMKAVASALQFSEMLEESTSSKEKILVIPIGVEFSRAKNISHGTSPYLVLICDINGKVKKGNLVVYSSARTEKLKLSPSIAISKILNSQNPELDGKFLFLGVTGNRLFELNYVDNKLKSFSYITKEQDSNNNDVSSSSSN